MIKSVLIPIDFNVESLNSLKIALANGKGKRVKVTLLYGYALSDSITELLFYSASKITRSLMNPEFEEAITIIESRFESMIDSISIELFHGLNTTAFINLIKAKNIDMIYIPKSYQLKHGKNGFNIIPFIKKSKLPYEEVEWTQMTTGTTSDQINSLFI